MEVCHRHHLDRKPTVVTLLAMLPLFVGPSLAVGSGGGGQPLPVAGGNSTSQLQTYIVHVRRPEHLVSAGPGELESWHKTFLPTPTLDSGEPRMMYSYQRAISGFAARLTPVEAEAMAGKEGFLAAHPDEPLVFETSWSYSFLRLSATFDGLWVSGEFGKGIVVAVVDSGINPGHASFDDTLMPAPPSGWTGRCDLRPPNKCNNKLVGALNFDAADPQAEPLDDTGHGTFVAGVLGSNFVAGADVHGLADGTAVGASPGVHLAVYRTHTTSGLVASFDQAILDGANVITASMSLPDRRSFHENDIAIAALSAVESGVFVACPAGNGGPRKGSVRNDAPWVLTVGAATMDRALRVILVLGNGKEYMGESLEPTGQIPTAQLGLVYPGEAGGNAAALCRSPLNGVAGMAVLCLSNPSAISPMEQGMNVQSAGGAVMILMNGLNNGSTLMLEDNVLPTVSVSYKDSQRIMSYLGSARSGGRVTLKAKGTIYAVNPHPTVASISGRGPSAENGGILKPDIVGPGVNIIGASSQSSKGFVMMSGTSVATPQLASVAALLKKNQSAWSPAAIRSAIMTSSYYLDNGDKPIVDESGKPAGVLAMGAGHVFPNRANDPGLVYDIQPRDYLRYLCGLGYTAAQVDAVARRTVQCGRLGRLTAEELNYPSISVKLSTAGKTVERRVRNEGPDVSTYVAEVVGLPPGPVSVDVQPGVLNFGAKGEEQTFRVTFSLAGGGGGRGTVYEGHLKWAATTSRHVVSSPLLVTVE